MTSRYSCFLFDFDGTLSDSRVNIVNSFNYAFQKLNLPQISEQKILPLIGKLNLEDTIQSFFPTISIQNRTSTIQYFRLYQKNNALGEIKLFPHVLHTVKNLKEKNIKLGIITTKNVAQIRSIVLQLNLQSYFDFIFGENLTKHKKPEKECVDFVLKEMGLAQIDRKKVVLVGDSVIDCRLASNAHIDLIAVTHGVDDQITLKNNGARYIIHSFSELTQFAEV